MKTYLHQNQLQTDNAQSGYHSLSSEDVQHPSNAVLFDRWFTPDVLLAENSVRAQTTRVTFVREIIVVSPRGPVFIALLAPLASAFRTRAAPRRLRLKQSDRLLWILLSRFWPGWRRRLRIVRPDTVVRWHRRAFVGYWAWKSRRRLGRPTVAAGRPNASAEPTSFGERHAFTANCSSWGTTWLRRRWANICAEAAGRHRGLGDHPEQPHEADGIDGLFFTVPTALFRVLFVFVVLSHDRRRVVHFNVTEHPTEEWTAQQIREASPWDEAPRYLILDRDAIFGTEVIAVTKSMG
jgi:hypothetical protein